MMWGMLDSGFSGPVNWAGREAQVEMAVITVQEGHRAIADAVMEKKTKARESVCLWRTMKITEPPQQYTTLKSGCEAWRKMLPKQKWEMMKQVIIKLSKRILVLRMQVEGEEDKVPHDYQETLLVDFPLQEEGVQIREEDGVPISQPWVEGLGRATKQEAQEGVWGRRSICQSSRMKGPRMLWLTIPGGGTYLLSTAQLAWPTLVAVHLLVVKGVPWRTCQEFRQGYYLNQHLTDIGQALWHGDDIWHFSKELYSLKQGSGENVAKFGMHLSLQVQILQSEYWGRIQQEHMEEMQQDNFYEGLNPKYWCMLAYKVDEHPAIYSDLLLAAQKLERWAETRDPLLPKTTITEGSNVTQPQASGNLFPSRKLKGQSYFHSLICHSRKCWNWRGLKCKPRRGRKGQTSKGENPEPWVKLVEQISQSAISSVLPMQSSCTRRKTEIVSNVAVLTILWKIFQKISAGSPEKKV